VVRLQRVLILLVLAVARSGAAQSRGATMTALSPFAAAKARTLMSNRLSCLGCHTLDGVGGRVGPDLTTVSKRRTSDYIAAIVDDPQGVVPGSSMPRIPMTPELRALVLGALMGAHAAEIPTVRTPSGLASPPARIPDGAPLYGRYCAACHGRTGGGDGPNARFLPVSPAVHRDASSMSARTDDRLFDAVYGGGYPLGRSAAMPAFGATLARAEIWALVRYMRTLCRCKPPAWSTDGEQPSRPSGER